MNIKEAKENVGKKVNLQCIVQLIERKTASNSKPFISFNFLDASGEIGGIVWSEGIKVEHGNIKVGSVVNVCGMVNTYQSTVNLNVVTVDVVEVTKEQKMALMPSLGVNKIAEYREMYYALVKRIENANYRQIFEKLDNVLNNYFFVYPAAKGYHHNYLGGLLEHTCKVTNACLCVAMNYDIDKDLLITGALLHDIGKIKEYTFESGVIDRTDEGIMLGHISLGIMILSNTLREQSIVLADNEKNKLFHMILSHHGKKEHGSPVEPNCREALILSQCDYFDFFDGHLKILEKEGNVYSKLLNSYVYVK